MGLVVNHNMMAMAAARNLGAIYGKLAVSTARLSSGLRINSAADDAAGLAVRESMRADIAVLNQGVRNAGDAISMIQTAEGALSVVDEKLIRMKELAEQAATGTYTSTQRAIMDSEYQAMAAEIDRIATATDFNGVKLLNGDLSDTGTATAGLKIHFGTGNLAAEDYYYIKIEDMRATESTGLQVGGGATADILLATTDYASGGVDVTGGASKYFGYSYDVSADGTATLSDFAGFYNLASGTTLSGMVELINEGTAAREFAVVDNTTVSDGTSGQYVQFGNLRVFHSTAAIATMSGNAALIITAGVTNASELASAYVDAINGSTTGNVWAVQSGSTIMLVYKAPGHAGNGVIAGATGTASTASFASVNLSGGGETWAVASKQTQTDSNVYLQLTGNNKGADYDITIQDANTFSSGNLVNIAQYNEQGDFSETDATGSGNWDGADILTQSAAQEALDQIATAIENKDNTRASLGSLSNRLENTITNLTVQAENLQAAESRVSDVDVALEMTEFTKNNILVQAAVAMLAQANTLPTLALTLLGGV